MENLITKDEIKAYFIEMQTALEGHTDVPEKDLDDVFNSVDEISLLSVHMDSYSFYSNVDLIFSVSRISTENSETGNFIFEPTLTIDIMDGKTGGLLDVLDLTISEDGELETILDKYYVDILSAVEKGTISA